MQTFLTKAIRENEDKAIEKLKTMTKDETITAEVEIMTAMTLKLLVEQLCIGQLTMGKWKLPRNFLKGMQVCLHDH